MAIKKFKIKTDPVENTKKYKMIANKLEAELAELMKDYPIGMGRCHRYWALKKKILSEKYNINWKSPVDMNPGVLFD
jgi:hypothetical protein